MGVLDAVRACGAPDCWVGTGALRDLVWDGLHGGFAPERVKDVDVDVAFFDPQDLRPERDQAVEDELVQLLPGVRWDAKNQAAVHLWYVRRFGVPVQPLGSTADGLATWPETATAVALQLRRDGRLAILAPYGLSDLLHGVCRRKPRRVSVEEYRRRGQRQADRPAMAARSSHRPGR
ncbi:MAG TPA: nucleotidyltransferase family protein [Actinomycetota bacterium]|nr:nucleotidyltransferase family protein [Actinomycetota bacterium]